MLGYLLAGLAIAFFANLEDSRDRYRYGNYNNDRKFNFYESEKEKEAEILFNQRKTNALNSFTNNILSNEFINTTNFCYNEIESEFNNSKDDINKYIDILLDSEKNQNIFSLRINQTLKNLSKKMNKLKVKHLNILLIGPSGVGKSYLINSILKLNKNNSAKSNIGKPITKKFNIYESYSVPNIRLIESRGIEKGNYSIDSLSQEIVNYIESRELSEDPDQFVHCIWYCITGTRFENIEEETLRKLSSVYDDSKLPIIVVYTQAIIPKYYNAINEEINKIKKNIEYIPIIAGDIKLADNTYAKAYNIDKLIDKSLEKAKNAVHSSVFSAVKKIVKNEIDFNIEYDKNMTKKNLTEFIKIEENQTIINEFKEEEYYNYTIKNLIYTNDININKIQLETIKSLINYLRNKFEGISDECLNNYANKKSDVLSNELMDIQNEVNIEKNGYLRNYKTRGQLKEEIARYIKYSISQKYKIFEMNNYIKIIPPIILDLLSEKIKIEFNNLLINNVANNELNKIIQNMFKTISFQDKNNNFIIGFIFLGLICFNFYLFNNYYNI